MRRARLLLFHTASYAGQEEGRIDAGGKRNFGKSSQLRRIGRFDVDLVLGVGGRWVRDGDFILLLEGMD